MIFDLALSHMRRLWIGWFLLVGVWSGEAAPRVGVHFIGEEVLPAVDILTAALASQGGLELLERAELSRVIQEQGLASGQGVAGGLQAGRLLGADGILVVELETHEETAFLVVRLIAVKTGVLIQSLRVAWPFEDAVAWGGETARVLSGHWARLLVDSNRALAVSLVGLRSPLQTEESLRLERSLGRLMVHRLVREPTLFVLDRSNLGKLSWERAVEGLVEDEFWAAGWTLAGRIDGDGVDPRTLHLDATLTRAGGQGGQTVRASGPRENAGAVLDQLAQKILEALLGQPPSGGPADRQVEAERFWEQARWAWRWRQLDEALVAADAAETLGGVTLSGAMLLTEMLSQGAPRSVKTEYDSLNRIGLPNGRPDEAVLQKALAASHAWLRLHGSLKRQGEPGRHPGWLSRGQALLERSSQTLLDWHAYAQVPLVALPGDVAKLRAQCRGMESEFESMKDLEEATTDRMINFAVQYGWLWQDNPQQGVAYCRELLDQGWIARARRAWLFRPLEFGFLPAWTSREFAERRERIGELVRDWRASKDLRVQAEGLAVGLREARLDVERHELLRAIHALQSIDATPFPDYLAVWGLDVHLLTLSLLKPRLTSWQDQVVPLLESQTLHRALRWLGTIEDPNDEQMMAVFGMRRIPNPVLRSIRTTRDGSTTNETVVPGKHYNLSKSQVSIVSGFINGPLLWPEEGQLEAFRTNMFQAYLDSGFHPRLRDVWIKWEQYHPPSWIGRAGDLGYWIQEASNDFGDFERFLQTFPEEQLNEGPVASALLDGPLPRFPSRNEQMATAIKTWNPTHPAWIHLRNALALRAHWKSLPSSYQAVMSRQLDFLRRKLQAYRFEGGLNHVHPSCLAPLLSQVNVTDFPMSEYLRLTPLVEDRIRQWEGGAAAQALRDWWVEAAESTNQWHAMKSRALEAGEAGMFTGREFDLAAQFIRESEDVNLAQDLVDHWKGNGLPEGLNSWLEDLRSEVGISSFSELEQRMEKIRRLFWDRHSDDVFTRRSESSLSEEDSKLITRLSIRFREVRPRLHTYDEVQPGDEPMTMVAKIQMGLLGLAGVVGLLLGAMVLRQKLRQKRNPSVNE